MTGPIETLWQEYLNEIVPADAGPVQRIECRRAFYGGVAALMKVLANSDDVIDEVEKDVISFMKQEGLWREEEQ